jgi:hypothetical protein
MINLPIRSKDFPVHFPTPTTANQTGEDQTGSRYFDFDIRHPNDTNGKQERTEKV